MKRYVKAFNYLKYNANPRGTVTGDCQTRALALAFDMSWDKVRRILRKDVGDMFNWGPHVSKSLREDFGCKKLDVDLLSDEDYLTVGAFCDGEGSHGTYLIICNSEGKGDRGNHLVCTIDGTIYDTWNSSHCRVIEVYVPTGNHRIKGIDVTSDIPRRIRKLSAIYEQGVVDYIRNRKFGNELASLLNPERYYDYRMNNMGVDYDSVQSFNFVVRIKPYIYVSEGNYTNNKIKSFNFTFTNEDTFDSAVEDMPDRVAKVVGDWLDSIKKQIQKQVELEHNKGGLRYLPDSKTLVNLYTKLPEDVKSNIVSLDTCKGYTCAVVNVDMSDRAGFHIAVLSKPASKLADCIRVCMQYGTDFWEDYTLPTVNVLPNGFVVTLGEYRSTMRREDIAKFSEFMESYSEYDEYHEAEDHGIDYYFRSWEIPKFLA